MKKYIAGLFDLIFAPEDLNDPEFKKLHLVQSWLTL
jgi:hypothetical protein